MGKVANVGHWGGASQETRVTKDEYGNVTSREDYAGPAAGDLFNLPVGVGGGVMPAVSMLWPSSAQGHTGADGVGLAWEAHAELHVPFSTFARGGSRDEPSGPAAFSVTAQYLNRYEELHYRGGFGLATRTHGVLLLAGYSFGFLGVEAGAGALLGAKLGVGDAGNVLDDSSFALASVPGAGVKALARATLSLGGGGGFLQFKPALRAAVSYQHLWASGAAPPGAPDAVGSLSFGAEAVFHVF